MGTMNINRDNDLKALVKLQANGQREQFQVVVRKLNGKTLMIGGAKLNNAFVAVHMWLNCQATSNIVRPTGVIFLNRILWWGSMVIPADTPDFGAIVLPAPIPLLYFRQFANHS
jgi:hypothetical protein